MNDTVITLDRLVSESLDDGGFTVAGGRDLYMEVADSTTGLVWMSAAPVDISDFEALQLEAPLVKVGVGQASMDCSGFHYSPIAPGEPVRERIINGRKFINVAVPKGQMPPSVPGGPVEILVDKAHVIGFAAGRSVAVLHLPDGDYVEVVGDSSADEEFVLPAGGSLIRIDLSDQWVVTLPSPTRTFFWFEKSFRSFQGPVTLPGKS